MIRSIMPTCINEKELFNCTIENIIEDKTRYNY